VPTAKRRSGPPTQRQLATEAGAIDSEALGIQIHAFRPWLPALP
jgi:hypothetical protein